MEARTNWAGMETLEPRLMLAGALDSLSEVFIETGQTTGGGELLHEFEFGFASDTDDWFDTARFQSPAGTWYDVVDCDAGDPQDPEPFYEWFFEIDSTDPAVTAVFTEGNYTLELTLPSAEVVTTVFDYSHPDTGAALAKPTQLPVFTHPLDGANEVGTDVSVSWEAVTDPAVASISVELWDMTDGGEEPWIELEPTATETRPLTLAAGHTYETELLFDNGFFLTNADGVSYEIFAYSASIIEFTTVETTPDPSPFDQIDEVSIERLVSDDDGETLYEFEFDFASDQTGWFDAARLQSPAGAWYDIAGYHGSDPQGPDPHHEWFFEVETTDQTAAAAFGNGIYTLELTVGGETVTTAFDYSDPDTGGDLAEPTQLPVFTSPTDGAIDVPIDTLFTWQPVTDQAVGTIALELWDLTDHVDGPWMDLEPTASQAGPLQLLDGHTYEAELLFDNGVDQTNADGVPYTIFASTTSFIEFTTAGEAPEPGPLETIGYAFIDRGITIDALGTRYEFELGFSADQTGWFDSARFQSPAGTWYDITATEGSLPGDPNPWHEWFYEIESSNPADATNFGDGTYALELTVGGEIVTTMLDYADPDTGGALAQPTQIPTFTNPADGAVDVPADTLFAWEALTDPAVATVALELWDQTEDSPGPWEDLDPSATQTGPLGLLDGHAYQAELMFDNGAQTTNADGVSYEIFAYSASIIEFTTVETTPDPSPFDAITGARFDAGAVFDADAWETAGQDGPAPTAEFEFSFSSLETGWFDSARMQTPTGSWYSIDNTEQFGDQTIWWFEQASTNPLAMLNFLPGDYTLELTIADAPTATTTFVLGLPGSGAPIPAITQMPNFTTPLPNGYGVATDLTLEWDAVTDANVQIITLDLPGDTPGAESRVELEPDAASHGPIHLSPDSMYWTGLEFRQELGELTTNEGVHYEIGQYTRQEIEFSTSQPFSPVGHVFIERGIVTALAAHGPEAIGPDAVQTLHLFELEFGVDPNAVVTGASFTSPGGTTYNVTDSELVEDEGQGWFFEVTSPDPADLADFGDGVYTLTVELEGAAPITLAVALADPETGEPLAAPATTPTILSPKMGAWRVSPNVTIEWEPITDPAVTSIWVEVFNPITDEIIDETELPANTTSWTPTGLTPDSVYVAHVGVANSGEGHTETGTFIEAVRFAGSEVIFNTCTDLLAPISEVFIFSGADTGAPGATDDLYVFELGFESDQTGWFEWAAFLSPAGESYVIHDVAQAFGADEQTDEGYEWFFEVETDNAAELADLTDGTYTLWIGFGEGVTASTSFEFGSDDPSRPFEQPTQTPVLTSPFDGEEEVLVDTTFTWQPVTDPDATGMIFELEAGDDFVLEEDFHDESTGWRSFSDWLAEDPSGAYEKLGSLTWAELAASANNLTEAADDASTLDAGQGWSIGRPIADGSTPAGITFIYTLPGDTNEYLGNVVVAGHVRSPNVYGPGNPWVAGGLVTDPAAGALDLTLYIAPDGQAHIENTSDAPVAFDGYTIASDAGALAADRVSNPIPTEFTLVTPLAYGTTYHWDLGIGNSYGTQNEDGVPFMAAKFISSGGQFTTETATLDLVAAITGESFADPALTDTTGVATLTVTNRGTTDAAGDLVAKVYISDDATLDASDVLVATVTDAVTLVARTGSAAYTVDVPIPDDLANGEYFLLADVDTSENFLEDDETNNVAVGELAINVEAPVIDLSGELTDTGFTGRVLPGDTGTLSLTLTNNGNIPAAKTIYVKIYASATTERGADAVRIATNTVGIDLAAGATQEAAIELTMPSSLPAGEYFLIAEIDSSNRIEESDETNNDAVSETVVEFEQPEIDLAAEVTAVTFEPTVAAGPIVGVGTDRVLPGDTGTIDLTVSNSGNVRAAKTVYVSVYASPTPERGADAVRLLKKTVPLNVAGDNGTQDISLDLTMPSSLATGEYFLIAHIDSSNTIAERDETNNDAASETTVDFQQPEADLTADVTGVSYVGRVLPGDTGTIDLTVTNNGNVPTAKSVYIAVYASATYERGADAVRVANVSTPLEIAADGGTQNVTLNLTMPDTLTTGDYYLIAAIDATDAVDESDEANNDAASAATISFEEAVADLSADVLDVSYIGRVLPGDAGTMGLLITNNGNTPAAKTISVKVWASTTAQRGTEAVLVTTASVSIEIAADGGTQAATIAMTVPSRMTTGEYYLIAQLDSANGIDEADETNNDAASLTTIDFEAPFADLSGDVTAVSYAGRVLPGDAGTMDLTVTNDGNIAAAKKISVKVYASATAERGDDAVLMGAAYYTVDIPADGGTTNLTVNMTAPSSLATGDYYLIAAIDATDSLAESDETNNDAVSAATISVEQPFVDVAGEVTDFSFVGRTLPGDAGTVDLLLTNDGNTKAAKTIYVEVYASTTAERGADAIRLKKVPLPISLDADGGTQAATIEVTIPAGIDTGEYYIIAKLDSSNSLAESDETNNDAVSAATISVEAPFIDLTAEVMDVTFADPVVPGYAPGTVTVDVTNNGNTDVLKKVTVRLYASPTQDIFDDATLLTTGYQYLDIGTDGDTQSLTIETAIPTTLAGGDYYFLALVDATDVLAESDETNNDAASETTVTVEDREIDLTVAVSDTAFGETIVPGDSGEVTMTVANEGNIPVSKGVAMRLYLSATAELDAEAVLLKAASRTVNLAAGGASTDVTWTVTVPATSPAGEYYLIAAVDAANVVAESDETNNTGATAEPITVAEPFVDLVGEIDEIIFDGAVLPGDTGSVGITVTNLGNIPAVGTIAVKLYASGTPELSETSVELATLITKVNLSRNGGTRALTASVTIPDAMADETEMHFITVVDAADAIDESDETNNIATIGGPVLADPFRDLRGELVTVDLPGTVIAGDTGATRINIVNDGNIRVVRTVAVGLYASASGELDQDAIALGDPVEVSLNLAPDGAAAIYTLPIVIPEDLDIDTEYQLIAMIDVDNTVAEASDTEDFEGNNEVLIGTPVLFVQRFGTFDGHTNVALTQTDPNTGQPVTFTLKNGGYGEVDIDVDTDRFVVELFETTSVSLAGIETAEGHTTTIEDITVNGDLRSLLAPTTSLGGSMTVTGGLGQLALADVDAEHLLTIGSGAIDSATIVLGNVTDLTIDSDTPIRVLNVQQWLDPTGEADTITTPWIGTIDSAGDFQPDLVISGVGAPGGMAVGSIDIAGDVADRYANDVDFDILTGLIGELNIAGTVSDFALAADGLKVMAAGAVTDATLDVDGPIGAIETGTWAAGSVTADSLKSLAVIGEFAANITLDSLTVPALGAAEVEGNVTGGTWTTAGSGAITITGTTDSWTLDAGIDDLKALTLGVVTDTDVTAGYIGSVKATSWAGGTIEADAIKALATTGDFGAAMSLNAGDALALSNASIGGDLRYDDLAETDWDILTGSVGSITVDGTVENFRLSGGDAIKSFVATEVASGILGDAGLGVGSIGTVRATNWVEGAIVSDMLKSLAIAGNFGADLTSGTGDGQAFGNAKIGGNITGGTWTIAGSMGSLGIAGETIDWSLNLPDDDLKSLTLDQATNTSVTATNIGSIKANRWTGGTIAAGWLKSLAITGDFGADIALGAGTDDALGSAKIGGDLTAGTWDIDGGIKSLAIAGDIDGWALDLNGADMKSLTLGSVVDGSVDAGNIGSIKAGQWLAGTVSGETIKGVAIAGDFGADVTVTNTLASTKPMGSVKIGGALLGGTWDISGPASGIAAASINGGDFTATSIKTIATRGNMTGATFTLTQPMVGKASALGKLSVTGTMSDTTIRTQANVGSVSVGAMLDSALFVGVADAYDADTNADDVLDLPRAAENFNPAVGGVFAGIKSLAIRGGSELVGDLFANSNVAAGTIGKATLQGAATDNGGEAFGVTSASTIKSLTLYEDGAKRRWNTSAWPDDTANLVVEVV